MAARIYVEMVRDTRCVCILPRVARSAYWELSRKRSTAIC